MTLSTLSSLSFSSILSVLPVDDTDASVHVSLVLLDLAPCLEEQGELRHSEGSGSWTGGLTICWHIIWKAEDFEPFLVMAVERVNVL